MTKKKKPNRLYYPTGCDILDLTIGETEGYGFQGGSILNIVGDSGSGKSFLACECVACMFHNEKEKEWFYDDCESGFTFNTKKLYNFDIIPDNIKDKKRSETVQELHCNSVLFFDRVKTGIKSIYICDSLDGLKSKESKNRSEERIKDFKKGKDHKEEGTYNVEKPKYLSQSFFPDIADKIDKKDGFFIVVSQTRDKIGSMFKSKTRAGGKALDFYSHYIMWVREICKIEKKGIPIGVVIGIKFRKAKNDRPFRQCMITIYFDYGIDNIGSNIDYLYDLRTPKEGDLKKSANRIQWNENAKDITIKNIVTFLKSNEEWHNKYIEDDPTNDLKRGDDKIGAVLKWIEKENGIKKEFDKEFGKAMIRDELIEWIESDENRKKELTRRVREKWEKIEQEVATKRPKKYSKK